MQQICETIVKIKSLKDFTKSESPKSKQKGSHYNSEGFLSELQLYEPIKLHGTLLQHMNTSQRNSQMHQHQSYITFNPYSKKFFVMIFNGKDKNVAIVEDLASLLPKRNALPDNEWNNFDHFVKDACSELSFINQSRF